MGLGIKAIRPKSIMDMMKARTFFFLLVATILQLPTVRHAFLHVTLLMCTPARPGWCIKRQGSLGRQCCIIQVDKAMVSILVSERPAS